MQIKCPKCQFSRDVPDEKIPPRTQLATCPKCKHKFKFRDIAPPLGMDSETAEKPPSSPQSPPPAPSSPTSDPATGPDRESIWDQLESLGSEGPSHETPQGPETGSDDARGVPWEHLETFGFFPGFVETTKQAMLRPMSFFGRMRLGLGLVKPLVYFLIISEIQALAQIVWQLFGIVPGMEGDAGSLVGISLAGIGSLFLLILLPILLTISLFIFAGLSHLCLAALRSASGGFEATFRAMCYGRAPLILSVVPFIGVLVGTFWTFYSTIIGFKQLHKSSLPAAAIGLFAPILLFVGLIFLLISTFAVQPGSTF